MKSCFLLTARVDLKGPTGTFFFHIFGKEFFSPKKINKNDILKKENSARPTGLFFCPLGGQETIIHLRMAQVTAAWHCNRLAKPQLSDMDMGRSIAEWNVSL